MLFSTPSYPGSLQRKRRRPRVSRQGASMKFLHGDKVRIKNLGVEGEVIEVRTRSIVVRFQHKGDLVERHFVADDLERLPTTKERVLEQKPEHE
jgi:hypothetical protein